MPLAPDDIQELARRFRTMKRISRVEILEDRFVFYEDRGEGKLARVEQTFAELERIISSVKVIKVIPKQSNDETSG